MDRVSEATRTPLAWLLICLAFTMTACGDGKLSLAEYSENFHALAMDLSAELAELDERMSTGNPSVSDAQETLNRAVELREEFQKEMNSLAPPDSVADLHDDLVTAHAGMIAAQREWALAAAGAGSLAELQESEAARGFRAFRAEVVATCEEFQQRLDATAERQDLAESAWVPSEMKEVVELVLSC